ncbi:FKBP5-like protein, partial [Mya arenaria]
NLNLAQAYLKVGKNSKARDCCDKALTFDGNNIKAYYRRGMANFADGEYETAKEDFQKVLEVEPQHKPAKDQIDKCIIKMAEKPKSDRELARKMMSGIGKQFVNLIFNVHLIEMQAGMVIMAAGMMALKDELAAIGDLSSSDSENNHRIRSCVTPPGLGLG